MLFLIVKHSRKRQRKRKLRRLIIKMYRYSKRCYRYFESMFIIVLFRSTNNVSPVNAAETLDINNGIEEIINPDMYCAVNKGSQNNVRQNDCGMVIIDDYCNKNMLDDNEVYLFPNQHAVDDKKPHEWF